MFQVHLFLAFPQLGQILSLSPVDCCHQRLVIVAGLEELETLEVRQYERLVQGLGSTRAHFRLIPYCRSKVSHSSTLGHSRSI